jgi:spore germination protein KA
MTDKRENGKPGSDKTRQGRAVQKAAATKKLNRQTAKKQKHLMNWKNLSYIESAFNHPDNKDIVIRRLCIGNGVNAFIFYLDGMADRNTINLSILRPLLDKSKYNDMNGKNLFDYIYDSVIETHQLDKADTHEKAINDVLTGNTAICIDGYPNYILLWKRRDFDKRNVDKPQVEGVVKGSQEAYNENLRTNITLVRRKLKNKDLTTEFFKIGERNNEQIAILYLKDLTDPSLVE